MKLAINSAAAAAAILLCFDACHAEDTTSPLTFTFATLTGGTVTTATTTYTLASTAAPSSTAAQSTSATSASATPPSYGSCSSSASSYDWWRIWPFWGPPWLGRPWKYSPTCTTGLPSSTTTSSAAATRYTVNPADLAYPVYQNASAAQASAPAGSGYPTVNDYINDAVRLFFLAKNDNSTNCQSCKDVFKDVQRSMRVNQELLGDIATSFCSSIPIIPFGICYGLFHTASTEIGGILPAMDLDGDDGSNICAFTFGLCPLPAPPVLDLNELFNGTTKPAPKVLTPSTKAPLKVLHFSDYHLDLRYVVGAESNCTGRLCCRVFPYDDPTAAVSEPASLFGNYLCDTPEALGTSTFRSIPKLAGEIDSFAFSIYTGDLVSHDIWALTENYVVANELEAYQQFKDSLGGVPVYPTLGNHDAFPQAFTAWPYQTPLLPTNASYPVRTQYNYQNVSDAWVNNGWLSAEDAATAVNTGLGIYRTMTKEGLVIISLNSDLWYYSNFYSYLNSSAVDPTGMLKTFISYLLEAEAADQPVWVIQHVPTGGTTSYESLTAASDLYYQIIDRFNNTIRGTFFGHTHRDEFSVFYTNNGTVKSADTAVGVAWIMPSVTPYTNLNAGWRYYLVDPDTFMVIDSINYYADISQTNEWQQQGDVNWQFEYSARATYDYAGTLATNEPLGPAFWHNVAQDIANNMTTFQTYTDLRSKLYRPYTAPSAGNRLDTICGLTSMSIPIFEDCLNSTATTSTLLRRRQSAEDVPTCGHNH